MKSKKITVIGFALAAMLGACQTDERVISLAGEWQVALDSLDVGVEQRWFDSSFTERMQLPGTTDEAGLGNPNTLLPSLEKPQILHLTRKHSYVGPAWYVREIEIPSDWAGQKIQLKLERALWQTAVWVDGKEVPGREESLVAPHNYDLTDYLMPGRHTLAIRVDNRKRYDISGGDMAHAYTNETQVMWNGVLGRMELTARKHLDVDSLRLYPDAAAREVRVTGVVRNYGEPCKGTWTGEIKDGKKSVARLSESLSLQAGLNRLDVRLPMGDSVKLWDEFSPSLYDLDLGVTVRGEEVKKNIRFGVRDLVRQGADIRLNGHKIFLRGTLECCIFPQTGRPPMTPDGWLKVFDTARSWGLNHLRFHSWCPPEAAFHVADSLGFYLQVELPLWPGRVGEDEAKNAFLYQEADRILAEYGNHPSFCFMSLGNELPNDFAFLSGLLDHVKQKDNRRLYTTTSFSFEGGHGDHPEDNDDYWVTQWTKKGWVRGQGVFDAQPPAFDQNFSASIEGFDVPVVTHEIGQYAVYPNLKEIEKYTGTLDPLNFKGVKKDLEEKGLLSKADQYLKASGKLAYLLYKEEIERALKTKNFSGFQLLDLHDFPGQGTALVGLLDAFWDSKGIVEPETFRQFCAPVVPLAYFPKAVYTNAESFVAELGVANYGNCELTGETVSWKLETKAGKQVASGKLEAGSLPVSGDNKVGTVNVSLASVTEATELRFIVSLDKETRENGWSIWVYPAQLNVEKGDVVCTDNWEEARQALTAGKDVLFSPQIAECNGLEGKFVPVFWSPVHFPSQAGTMGLLLDAEHPAFADFPTDDHTDWQWWYLAKQSRPVVLDSIHRGVTPLVECVDNFVRNRRLSVLFETQCGPGRLLFSSMNLLNSQEDRPEKRQLLYSLLRYMQSDNFRPSTTLSFDEIDINIHNKNK